MERSRDILPFPDLDGSSEAAFAAPGMAAVWAKPRNEHAAAASSRVPVGVPALDDHLGGGIPAGATVIVSGPPFGGKRTLACDFLATGLARSEPVLAVLTDGDLAKWRTAVASLSSRVPEDRKGLACFLDLFGATQSGGGRWPQEALPSPDMTLMAVQNACDALPSDRRRVVLDSFSTITALCGFTPALAMLMRLTSLLRREGATSLILVESGAHTAAELQLIQRQADGAIDFRHYGGVPEVQVQGLGLAAPSPWLQVRHDPHPTQTIRSLTA